MAQQPGRPAIADVDKQFISERQGKTVVAYAGLLDAAHRSGLKRISTKLLQAPTAENGQTCICWAEAEMEYGTFTGIGDASPTNVGKMIAMHAIRMSETRAKARALRDALNINGTAREELGPDDDDTPGPEEQRKLEELYQTLGDAQTLIKEQFGVLEPVALGMTLAQAQARYNELRATYSRLRKQADASTKK